jgi:hypothetical protein
MPQSAQFLDSFVSSWNDMIPISTEAGVAQTRMPMAKISIKGETKCSICSAKTIWIHMQKKKWIQRALVKGVRSPGF